MEKTVSSGRTGDIFLSATVASWCHTSSCFVVGYHFMIVLETDNINCNSIDGALDPWLTTLTTSLLTLLPLPPSLHPLPASSLPPARVKLIDVSETHSNLLLAAFETGPSNEPAPEASASHSYPANNLSGVSGTSVAENNASRNYHRVKVLKNERITADGWWQDVRHFEFESEDELRYVARHLLLLLYPYFV